MKNTKTIFINSKEMPIKFGVNQSIQFCKLRKVSITKMNELIGNMDKDDGSIIRDLIWSALKDGARIKKQSFKASSETVGDWLDELGVEEISDILNIMLDGNTSVIEESVENKKKVTQ